MNETTENYLKLPDGRQLCYAEYGDPKSLPIFVFHGNPSSRLLWKVIPGSPFLPNVRLVAPDRPGYGRTDFVKGVTTLEDWPIPLNEIKTKVFLWQGEEDAGACPALGRYIAKNIPNCDAEFIEGEGHLWIFEHLPEMLEKLVSKNGSS